VFALPDGYFWKSAEGNIGCGRIVSGLRILDFSALLRMWRVSRPHVAFLGRIPGTNNYSDIDRHPENEARSGVIAFRPEVSLIYGNADAVQETALNRLRTAKHAEGRMVICDLSASPYLGLAGSHMLKTLHSELAARGVKLRLIGAHGPVRDLLRADSMEELCGRLDGAMSLDSLLRKDVQ
jgi:SulP family sulfate permease